MATLDMATPSSATQLVTIHCILTAAAFLKQDSPTQRRMVNKAVVANRDDFTHIVALQSAHALHSLKQASSSGIAQALGK